MVKHVIACSLVLLILVCALNVVAGASIKQRVTHEHGIDKTHDVRLARQATDDEGSSEDSDEDDEGAVADNSYVAPQAAESSEDSDEDDGDGDEDGADDDDDELSRRRRDAEAPVEKLTNETVENAEQQATELATAVDKVSETTIAPTGTVAPTRKSSVLVQIRDALKKVTTGLPTEQVATNALQYFQLFEHFIQQTIERYIDEDDDEEDEVATIAAAPATTNDKPEGLAAAAVEVPSSAEKEGGTKTPEASLPSTASMETAAKPDSVGEKPATETAETPAAMQAAKPTEPNDNGVVVVYE